MEVDRNEANILGMLRASRPDCQKHPGASLLDLRSCHGRGSRTTTPPPGPPRAPGRAVEDTT
eukprot:11183949-Lingulodinium_polyedra.AAC.1